MWTLYFTKQAQKDGKKLKAAGLKGKAESLLEILKADPFQTPPPYEKLVGDLAGAYSRRINIQSGKGDRYIYESQHISSPSKPTIFKKHLRGG